MRRRRRNNTTIEIEVPRIATIITMVVVALVSSFSFSFRCSKQCCAKGHRLNVCPALKTHLAHKLGRKMTAKDKLWKSGDGLYYYRGAFLKK